MTFEQGHTVKFVAWCTCNICSCFKCICARKETNCARCGMHFNYILQCLQEPDDKNRFPTNINSAVMWWIWSAVGGSRCSLDFMLSTRKLFSFYFIFPSKNNFFFISSSWNTSEGINSSLTFLFCYFSRRLPWKKKVKKVTFDVP